MYIKIDDRSSVPAYLQIYTRLREDIVKRVYPCGSRLPSKRIMAAESGTSIITVEHAYALLCDEGYIESRERSGYFVIFNPNDGFASFSERPASHTVHDEAFDAESKFPISVLTKTMRQVITDYPEEMLIKSPGFGLDELRETLCRYLVRNRGIHADIDQIVIGAGSEYLYGMLALFFGRGKIFALENPSYGQIERVYRASGIVCELLPLGPDGILSSALAATNADVLHISPYRSFPTGITASASKRYEYLEWAKSNDRVIIEDDFESEFSVSSKPEESLFMQTSHENVIYMNTFTKTISPALRVGYMVLPKRLADSYAEKAGCFSCTVPTFEQLLLCELIGNGDFERHINRVRRARRKARGKPDNQRET